MIAWVARHSVAAVNIPLRLALIAACTGLSSALAGERMDVYEIGERGTARIEYPHWFKQSFLDLRDDLAEAGASGKRGVILMLSQSNCSHCQAFLDTTLSDPATVRRVQAHYDVVALDIFSDLELTNIDGSVSTVKDFAETVSARLTPTLIFLGTEGRALLKVIGFYPPETFEHVLDYIDGAHYERSTLSSYIQAQATDSQQQKVASVMACSNSHQSNSHLARLRLRPTKRGKT